MRVSIVILTLVGAACTPTDVTSPALQANRVAPRILVESPCVRNWAYWAHNPDQWPSPYSADANFFDPDPAGVSHTWLETLNTPPRHHSAWFTLAREYITAVLNGGWEFGSDHVLQALDDTEDWFDLGPGWGVDVPGSVSNSLFQYADVLEGFNKGKDTLPRCHGK